jgi:hypothetical protein
MRPSIILTHVFRATEIACASLLLCATLPLAAQSDTSHNPSQYRLPVPNTACPVGLRADRRASVISREIDGKAIPTGQGLVLHFLNKPDRHVVSADITIHGYAGGVIAQPLTVNSRRDTAEQFHLSGSAAQPLIESTIWTEKIHGITWLELTRVTFSDGTSWQRSTPNECRVEPSLFVLVK